MAPELAMRREVGPADPSTKGASNMMKRLAVALGLALGASLFAAGASHAAEKAAGTIVAVTEEVVKLKGADGKTYEVKAADVVAENLTNGDVVEYEIVEGMPVKVKKKAK